MATREEALAELYNRGLLNEQQSAAVEELGRRGSLDLGKPAAPEQTDFRQQAMSELAEEVGPLQAFLIGAGKGMTDIGRGVGLVEPAGEIEKESIGALKEERPYTTGAGEIAGQAAPFLIPGTAAGRVAALPARALASGIVGGAEGAIIQRGTGGTGIEGAGMGAAVGMGAELLFPVLGRLGRKVYQRVTGRVPKGAMLDAAGQPTAELQEALDTSGMTFDDLTQDAAEVISKQQGVVPEQVVRKEFLEAQGIEPTKAQITRNAADFQAQQEAAKTSSRVRDALEAQEAALTTRFDQKVLETGGKAYSPTASVVDKVVDKATTLDQEISDLYKQARESAPGSEIVALKKLVDQVKRYRPSNRKTGGNISAIIGELQDKGVLDKKMKLAKNVTVEQAEEVRQYMNMLYDPQNGFGNMVLRELKNSLDDDVFKGAGGDLFGKARTSKANFEKELNRAKISKFDSRKQNLVRDILENKIDPDQMVDKVVFGKTWRPNDLKQLQDYIGIGSEWNDLKAEVLEKIKINSFIGPEDASGFKALSRHKLENTLNKIGDKKLKIIFNNEEYKFLQDMMKVSKLREPVRGTALGKGPSAQAIKSLEQRLKNLPVIGSLVDFVDLDVQGRMAIKAKPEKVKVPYLSRKPQLLPAATAAGIATAVTDTEER
jgi:hypothetical protein